MGTQNKERESKGTSLDILQWECQEEAHFFVSSQWELEDLLCFWLCCEFRELIRLKFNQDEEFGCNSDANLCI
jgi:hypothetical protein